MPNPGSRNAGAPRTPSDEAVDLIARGIASSRRCLSRRSGDWAICDAGLDCGWVEQCNVPITDDDRATAREILARLYAANFSLVYLPPLRCDHCGRFVSYADVESGRAVVKSVPHPDAWEGGEPKEELVCARCNV